MASDEGERYEGSWFESMNLPKNQDWEINLLEDLKRSGFDVPAVHDQGRRPSCVFHAIGYAVELEIAFLAWYLKKKQGLPQFNIDNFILQYEAESNSKLGVNDHGFNRVKVALAVFKKQGVSATGTLRPIQISQSRSYGYLTFEQTAQMIYSNHGMVGGFPVTSSLYKLGPNDIYQVRREGIPANKWADFTSHLVCFVGFGVRGGREYLVFVNSWGEVFGGGGVGRVYFDQVYQHNDGQFCLHSVQIPGGSAPDVPVRRGNPATWRRSRDPRYPVSWDGGNIRFIHPTPSIAP
jgi:hypothetical protein